MDAHCGTFSENTVTGNFSVTGTGFQGNLLRVWCNARTTTGVATDMYFSLGVSDGTNERSLTTYQQDGVAAGSALAHRWSRNSLGVVANTSILGEFSLVSFDVDGFTLNQTTSDGTARVWQYEVLSVPNAKVGQFTTPSTLGTVTETIGFQATAIQIFALAGTAHPVNYIYAVVSMGVCDGDLNQVGLTLVAGQDFSPTGVNRYHHTSSIWVTGSWVTMPTRVGDIDLIDSTSFRLNITTASTADIIFYAAWDPPNAKVEPAQTYPTSTGSVTYDPGFTPKSFLQLGAGCTVAQQDAEQSNALLDFGAADDSANQGVVWIGSEDNLATSNANRYQDASNVSVQYDKTGTTLQQKGAVTGLHLVGAKVDWTTVPATALSGAWLQIGDASGNTWTDTADDIWKDLPDTAWYPQSITGGLIRHPGMTAGMQLMAGGVRG